MEMMAHALKKTIAFHKTIAWYWPEKVVFHNSYNNYPVHYGLDNSKIILHYFPTMAIIDPKWDLTFIIVI